MGLVSNNIRALADPLTSYWLSSQMHWKHPFLGRIDTRRDVELLQNGARSIFENLFAYISNKDQFYNTMTDKCNIELLVVQSISYRQKQKKPLTAQFTFSSTGPIKTAMTASSAIFNNTETK